MFRRSGRDEATDGVSVLDAADWKGHEYRSRRRRRRLIALLAIAFFAVVAPRLMSVGTSALGPALRAAQDQGIRGTFTAEDYDCRGVLCEWTGVFVADHGRTRLRDVGYNGDMPSNQYRGLAMPALDSGDPATVYPAGGSSAWVADLLVIAAAPLGVVIVIAMLAWREWALKAIAREMSKPPTPEQLEQAGRLYEPRPFSRDWEYEERHVWQRVNPILRSETMRGPGRHTPH